MEQQNVFEPQKSKFEAGYRKKEFLHEIPNLEQYNKKGLLLEKEQKYVQSIQHHLTRAQSMRALLFQ